MFVVTFSDIDRDILKINKGFKSKKGHSLVKAENMLKELHQNINNTKKITLVLTDTDNELDYIFENIKIDPSQSIPNLLEILNGEISSSGHEDAQRLISDLEKTYQMELRDHSFSSREVKNKRKLGGLSKYLKKAKNYVIKNPDSELENNNNSISNSNDDFAEIEELQSFENDFEEITETETDSDFSDFVSVSEENTFNEQWIENDSVLIESEETNFHNQNVPREQTVENENVIGAADDVEIEIYDDLPVAHQKHQDTNQEEQRNDVVFPTYESYLDMSAVEKTIERYKQRFNKEHLVKFLGISQDTDLDKLKLKYAMNALDESDFVLLKDFFYNSVENIRDKIQRQLIEVYESCMLFNYEEEAKKGLKILLMRWQMNLNKL